LLDASLPVARLATAVHHRDYQDELGFNGVKDSIGENMSETAANIVI